uniref:Protein HGH1 C-terminal domain-containing protein n=1 Tax=Setaria digitata TaxID=48799 RepID=A0A915Q4F7_9BILA
MKISNFHGLFFDDKFLSSSTISPSHIFHCSLLQLCGSEFGRETLRIKGIYALLREFDRASSASASLSSSLSLSAGKKRRNSQVAPSVAPINEHHITDNRSYSTGQHVQMDSAVYDAQEMGAADVKCLGETENLTYIDGKNCSTLHAVIGILIED